MIATLCGQALGFYILSNRIKNFARFWQNHNLGVFDFIVARRKFLMKNLRKRTALFGFLYTFSIGVYAGDAMSDSMILAPTPGFGGSIAGLYLQPNANNLTYAIYTTPLPLPAPNWYQQTINPDYAGAFALGLHYNFADLANKVKLDWLHLNTSDSASFAVTDPNTSVGPPFYFGPAEQFILNTTANSTVKFNIDNVNLVFGHSVQIIDNIQLEPFWGVSAVYLKEDITNNYTGTDPFFGPYTHSVYTDSKFTGFGPRLGLDVNYFSSNNFGVNAGLASSLFVGRLASSTDFTSWTAFASDVILTNTTPANTTLSNKRQTVVVPEIDGKLGLFYTTALNDTSILTIQVGYMFQDYINSIYQVLPSTLVPTAWEGGTVAIINQVFNQSDLSMNGPYIKLVLN